MTTIICTKCGEAVEVTKRSVVLPFVCDSCVAQIEEFNAEVTAAAVSSAKELTKATQIVPEISNDVILGTPLTEEFASIENTTALINDLQAQLEAAKNEASLANEAKILAEQDAEELDEEANDLASQCLHLEDVVDELNADLDYTLLLNQALGAAAIAVKSELERTKARGEMLVKNAEARGELNFQDANNLRRLNMELESRLTFWISEQKIALRNAEDYRYKYADEVSRRTRAEVALEILRGHWYVKVANWFRYNFCW